MSKRAIFIFVLIIIFIIFFVLGFKIQSKKEPNNLLDNNITLENTENILEDNEVIEVNASEEKTTPNTILILRKEYTDCGHTINSKASIPEEMVNLTEEEIIQKYPNWELEEFSKEQIVLSKTLDSFCGEHYLLTEEDGYISIYTVDEEENKALKEQTKISVEYLPETDRISLKNGLMIYGTENLNKLLEDFEA